MIEKSCLYHHSALSFFQNKENVVKETEENTAGNEGLCADNCEGQEGLYTTELIYVSFVLSSEVLTGL